MLAFKFRAWHKPTGIMIPWEHLRNLMNGIAVSCGSRIEVSADNRRRIGIPRECTIQPCNPFAHPDLVMMQSTGLKESGRAEIYQGDIIDAHLPRYSLPIMGEIVYSLDHGSWANKNDGGITLIHELTSIRVVGNVYENPGWRR
jgi:hypothetical protein